MTSYFDFSVTLFRDSLSTPWGFRLEGGRDYQIPLTIQRVFTGSPASGDLQRGDVITSIQNRDASFLLHQEANDIIRNSGGSIQLGIRRAGSSFLYAAPDARPTSATPYRSGYSSQNPIGSNQRPNNLSSVHAPSHLFNAEDPLSSYIRSRPIEKTRDPKPILSQTGSPMMPGATPSYNTQPSVKRYRPHLAKLPTTNFAAVHHQHQPAYQTTNSSPIPYSEKAMINQLHNTLTRVTSKPPPPMATSSYGAHSPTRSLQHQHNYSAYSNSTLNLNQHDGSAPWQTSLRRTGQEAFESQYQPMSPTFRVGHSSQPVNKVFSQHEASDLGSSGAAPKSPMPRAINLQYNSPIGLYSNENIQEEFYKKVGAHFAASSEF